VLAAAGDLPDTRAVVDDRCAPGAEHVLSSFHADLGAIERTGEARVELAGRRFAIRGSSWTMFGSRTSSFRFTNCTDRCCCCTRPVTK
jgi:hypothetical protein